MSFTFRHERHEHKTHSLRSNIFGKKRKLLYNDTHQRVSKNHPTFPVSHTILWSQFGYIFPLISEPSFIIPDVLAHRFLVIWTFSDGWIKSILSLMYFLQSECEAECGSGHGQPRQDRPP